MKFWLGTHKVHWLWNVQDVPLFVSHRQLRSYKRLPRAVTSWALDSGGFTELSTPPHRWQTTPAEYVDAVYRYRDELGGLAWASPQDSMCEPWIVEATGLTVEEHQRRTVANLLELRALAPDLTFIPVLQGWEMTDYERCLTLYAAAGVDLWAEPLVGVGSVCRRQRTGQIEAVLGELARTGLPLHAYGVKSEGLLRSAHHLTSADSMAWSFAGRMTHRRGCDCSRCVRRPQDQANHCGAGHRAEAHCLTYALRWRAQVLDAIDAPKQLAFGVA